jgi:hypothetical protein
MCMISCAPRPPVTPADLRARMQCYQKGVDIIRSTACEEREVLLQVLLESDADCIAALQGDTSFSYSCETGEGR